MATCPFCTQPVSEHDESTWQQVTVWVGGPKKNGATLAGKPVAFAHDACIRRARSGNNPDTDEINFDG